MRFRRLFFAAVCAILAVVAWLAWALLRPGPGTVINFEVSEGASTAQVLRQLERNGLLPSPVAGRLYLKLFARGRSVRWGHYRMPPSCRPAEALEQVLNGRVQTLDVTLVEGSDRSETAAALAAAGIGSASRWQELIDDPQWVLHLAPEATNLEGFLFPDTYRFAFGLAPQRAARHIVDHFFTVWEEESATVDELWGSPFEILTLASLVEAETNVADERPRVAGVFLNRLRRGMLLQCDPTVVFALKQRGEWQGRLLRIHWEVDHPYNTYRYPGLPPGPINSPGRSALAAAMAPEKHGFLYFVATPEGGHTFSTNLRDHNRAVWRLRHASR